MVVVHPDGHIVRRSGLGPHRRRYHSRSVHFDDLVRFLLEGIVNRETLTRLRSATPGTTGTSKSSGRVAHREPLEPYCVNVAEQKRCSNTLVFHKQSGRNYAVCFKISYDCPDCEKNPTKLHQTTDMLIFFLFPFCGLSWLSTS